MKVSREAKKTLIDVKYNLNAVRNQIEQSLKRLDDHAGLGKNYKQLQRLLPLIDNFIST